LDLIANQVEETGPAIAGASWRTHERGNRTHTAAERNRNRSA
jgi:hypothetical protein